MACFEGEVSAGKKNPQNIMSRLGYKNSAIKKIGGSDFALMFERSLPIIGVEFIGSDCKITIGADFQESIIYRPRQQVGVVIAVGLYQNAFLNSTLNPWDIGIKGSLGIQF